MGPPDDTDVVKVPTAITPPRPAPAHRPVVHTERIALVDLLDRVLAGGVVLSGEVTLSVADVDLVTVSLRALVTSASTLARAGANHEVPGR
jgi:Gas vesicle protein